MWFGQRGLQEIFYGREVWSLIGVGNISKKGLDKKGKEKKIEGELWPSKKLWLIFFQCSKKVWIHFSNIVKPSHIRQQSVIEQSWSIEMFAQFGTICTISKT